VARALLDRVEDLGQALRVAAPQQLAGRLGERGDGRERVVELMADHADHLLPRLHFLAAQLRGEVAQEEELVAPAVQVKPRRAR
jgi:hypothetical protein